MTVPMIRAKVVNIAANGFKMRKWLAWHLKIGWKIAYEWVGDNMVETTWVHKKTGETRIERQSITWW